MQRSSFPLTLLAVTVMAAAPAAAKQLLPVGSSVQSGARVQVTVSARIVSGESVYLGRTKKNDAAKSRSKSYDAPMVRTSGEITLDGEQRVALTEFH